MSRFFVTSSEIGDREITISGIDFNHIKNVLRKKPGDRITVCDGIGNDYSCEISEFGENELQLAILSKQPTNVELPVKLVLYQGLPKSDKMEFIIQKAVELGAVKVVPVACKRCVLKLEEGKKADRKIERWQSIAESAAKQSGRGIVPQVPSAMSFSEAMKTAVTNGPVLFPYENADGMKETEEAMEKALKSALHSDREIGIFIGPEGGFDPNEVTLALSSGASVVSLGKRILRTETAGLAVLSVLMMKTEVNSETEGTR